MNKVAVCLVFYKDKNHLARLIPSLLKQTFVDFNIYAIENSESQSSISQLLSSFPNAVTLPYCGNLGYAKANNLLAEKAIKEGCDYLMILNTDTFLSNTLIELLVDDLIKNNNVIASSPVIYKGDYKSGLLTDKIESCGVWCDFINARITLRNEMNCDDRRIIGISGSCFMINSTFIKKFGLFNTDNFMYGDELDLCYRISNNKFRMICNYDAQVWHFHNYSSNNKFMYFYINRNRFLFFHRYKKCFDMAVTLLKECLIFPIRIKWIISKMGVSTIKYYYLGIYYGIINKRGKIDISFK